MNKSIVITGMGAVTPLGVGARTLYERWLAGQSGLADGKGEAREFDPTDHLSVKEARRADRFSQFAIVAGDEALAEAGWSDELPYEHDRIASILRDIRADLDSGLNVNQACRKAGKYIGICGQGPSDHPELARWLVEQGIESMSLNPDTVVETWLFLASKTVK